MQNHPNDKAGPTGASANTPEGIFAKTLNAIFDNLRSSGRLNFYIGMSATFAVLAATFMQFVATEKWFPSSYIGMAISTFALLLSGLSLYANKNSAYELEVASTSAAALMEMKRDLERARDLSALKQRETEDSIDAATDRLNQANVMLEALRWIHEAIEQSLSKSNVGPETFMPAILEPGALLLKQAFKFETDQAFAINVYESRKTKDATKHHLVAVIRSTECKIDRATVWAEREGVVGHCFSTNQPILIDDSSDRSVASIIAQSRAGGATPGSFVAHPIRAGKPGEVWGVVVASNSEPYHFDGDDPHDISASSPAGKLRLLAGVLALAVQSHRQGDIQ